MEKEGETTIKLPLNLWAVRLAIWTVAFAAFIVSCETNNSCRFLKISSFNPQTEATSVEFVGIWSFLSNVGVCVSTSLIEKANAAAAAAAGTQAPEVINSSQEVARAFSIMSPVLGGITMVLLLSMVVKRMSSMLWKLIASLFIICCFFQSLTFLMFNSVYCQDEEIQEGQTLAPATTACSLGEGAELSIVAAALYLVAGLVALATPPPTCPMFECIGCNSGENQPVTTYTTTTISPNEPRTTYVTKPNEDENSVTEV